MRRWLSCKVNSNDPDKLIPIKNLIQGVPASAGFDLSSVGFRPFFLLACLAAVIMPALWMFSYKNFLTLPSYYTAIGWHTHEMIFGYAAAVIAGFLLTSIRIWTGRHTLTGWPLLWLAMWWLAARLLPFAPGLSPMVLAVVDLLFLPILALVVLGPVMAVRQWHNTVFSAILLLMAGANLMIHLEALAVAKSAGIGMKVGLYSVLLFIIIMGGRVIPFFISHRAFGIKPRSWRVIEYASAPSLVVLALADILEWRGLLLGLCAGVLALVQAIRLSGWLNRKIWAVPLLWILVVAYFWLVVGFGLLALSCLGWEKQFLAMHALTTGGIGVMTLGLMARVALGHSGRMLHAHWLTVCAFVLVNLAVVVRVVVPALMPSYYVLLLTMSTLIWMAGFLAFLLVYAPILLTTASTTGSGQSRG